jgi:hypothetical protein
MATLRIAYGNGRKFYRRAAYILTALCRCRPAKSRACDYARGPQNFPPKRDGQAIGEQSGSNQRVAHLGDRRGSGHAPIDAGTVNVAVTAQLPLGIVPL